MLKACETMRVPGRELLRQDRAQLRVERRQQVERHDGGLGDVGLQHVLLAEIDQLLDARGFRIRPRLFDAIGIDVEADAFCAVFLRRGDGNSPVAASQVEDDVIFCDLRQGEHAVDDFVRGGHVRDEVLGSSRGRQEQGREAGGERAGSASSDSKPRGPLAVSHELGHSAVSRRPAGCYPLAEAVRTGADDLTAEFVATLFSDPRQTPAKRPPLLPDRPKFVILFATAHWRTPNLATLLQWGTRDIPGW